MKKISTFLLIITLLILKTSVLAQTPTPTVSDKIQELKEKVAEKVADLKKEKLGGLAGTLKSSTDEALILNQDGTQYSIQLDEDTKVFQIETNLRKKEIKLSSIEENTPLCVIGEIDKNEKTGLAKIVVVKEPNIVIVGKVVSVSTKDGTITVESLDGKTYVVDIEVSTKNNFYNLEKNTLAKIGLSKIEQESRIHVYAIKGKEEGRLTTLRVLILPKDLKVGEITPTAEATPTSTPTP